MTADSRVDFDAAEVGYRVGYDDPSHFSREFSSNLSGARALP